MTAKNRGRSKEPQVLKVGDRVRGRYEDISYTGRVSCIFKVGGYEGEAIIHTASWDGGVDSYRVRRNIAGQYGAVGSLGTLTIIRPKRRKKT